MGNNKLITVIIIAMFLTIFWYIVYSVVAREAFAEPAVGAIAQTLLYT